MEDGKITEVDCKDCGPNRKHDIISIFQVKKAKEKEMQFHEEGEEIIHETISTEHVHSYMIIQCCGCNNTSFLETEQFFADNEEMGPFAMNRQYPNQKNHSNDQIFLSDDDAYYLPNFIYNLYDEIKVAFKSESCVLAGLGLRTLVEAICIHQNIPGNNLHTRIQNLSEAGYISKQALPILDKLRLIGNASAHKIKSLPIDKLEYALNILNHVLTAIYILPKISKKIKI